MWASGPSERVRKFVDDGRGGDQTRVQEWVIKEREALDVPGVRGRRCLVFMSERAVRRVWEYPENWFELSDDELRALRDAPIRTYPGEQPPGARTG